MVIASLHGCQYYCGLVSFHVSLRLSISPCRCINVTISVTLCDSQSHCIFDSEVPVTVTVSASTGVIVSLLVSLYVTFIH